MEVQIVQYLQQLGHSTIVDSISQFISWMPFLGALWFVIMVILMRKYKTRRRLILTSFVLSALLFFIISERWLKHVFVDTIGFRERPYVVHSDVISPIGKSFADTSFPSDHMASAVAMLTVILFFVPGVWPFAIAFVLLMAFSRMHNGMHYPSDILVGTMLGICYGITGVWIAKKVIKNK